MIKDTPSPDHPRGCGENWLSDLWGGIKNGSPPRMRGKPSSGALADAAGGITPADAGKTFFRSFIRCRRRDHPRGCGENAFRNQYSTAILGSPPRMRGKRSCKVFQQSDAGITPADAGKTVRSSALPLPSWDHPRGCGENVLPERTEPSNRGSPPRMRGKRLCPHETGRAQRITPADAGKTFIYLPSLLEIWDHPRGCGENMYITRTALGFLGSPPRMR